MSEKWRIIPETSRKNDVALMDGEQRFGYVSELTPVQPGQKGSLAIVRLHGSDFIHHHEKTEEIYFFREGSAQIFLDGRIFEVDPGDRVIIPPGVRHAAKPSGPHNYVMFEVISSPPFDPKDEFRDPQGRDW